MLTKNEKESKSVGEDVGVEGRRQGGIVRREGEMACWSKDLPVERDGVL